MRRTILYILLIGSLFLQSFSSVYVGNSTENPVSASKISPLINLSVPEILKLTPRTYKDLTGAKMKFKDRLALKIVQYKIKQDLRRHGKVDLQKYVAPDGFVFNFGGFALGLLLGLIGVALAHIFSKDKSFRRSSWYGIGVLIIIIIIAAAAG